MRLLSILLFAPSAAAIAAEIYLKDGTVVIGTIEALADGEDLTVDTEYMDDVVIEWDAIERIEGAAAVNVELFSGRRMLGNLSLEDGRLYVRKTADPAVREEIDADDVFEISDHTNRWTDGFDAYLNLGFNVVRGNNQVTQVTYGGGVSFDGNRFESGLDSTLILNEQTGAPDNRRLTVAAHHDQKLSEHWNAGGLYQFESDDQQQLTGRSLLAGVFSRRLVNNRVQRLTLSGGLAVNAEDFESQESSESLEALIGAGYRLRSRSGIDVDAKFFLLPSLTDSGRVRAQSDATLSMDLLGDLDLELIYYNRYDSAPPVAVNEFDYGVTLALGYEF